MATYWFKKAAEQNSLLGQENLGIIYLAKQDYFKAIYWLRKAAERNSPKAQRVLGVCYYNGIGVAQSKEEGLYWLRKACDNFSDEACNLLNELKNEQ